MHKFNLYNGDELVAITENGMIKKISENIPSLLFHFGRSEEIPMWDFLHWVETTRLIDRNRTDLEFVLKRYGLEKYDVIDLARATGGRKIHDKFWIEVID